MRVTAKRRLGAAVAAGMAVVLATMVGCAVADNDAQNAPAPEAIEANAREFGISSDPWKVDDWAAAVGARPTMVMEFEQWHKNRTLDTHFQAAREQGLDSFMVTWEPWVPVPAELGKEAQYKNQPEYSNKTIVEGGQDDYIRSFARSIAESGLTVYVRYAHEMNGDWYPWSRDSENYVLAWRHIVDIFREEGAVNAKFVFSLNPSLYAGPEEWTKGAQLYWPGDGYVDLLGTTMISFGGEKDYTVAEFAERIALMHDVFDKNVFVTELNTAYAGRVKWLTDLRTWLETEAPWVTGVVLSQEDESRGQVQLGSLVGNLTWNVMTDPETQPVIKAMIEDLNRPY